MSEMTPLFVGQIHTTGLQPEGLLSANPEEYKIHKWCISKKLWEGQQRCNGFNDQFQMKRADNFLKLPALAYLPSESAATVSPHGCSYP